MQSGDFTHVSLKHPIAYSHIVKHRTYFSKLSSGVLCVYKYFMLLQIFHIHHVGNIGNSWLMSYLNYTIISLQKCFSILNSMIRQMIRYLAISYFEIVLFVYWLSTLLAFFQLCKHLQNLQMQKSCNTLWLINAGRKIKSVSCCLLCLQIIEALENIFDNTYYVIVTVNMLISTWSLFFILCTKKFKTHNCVLVQIQLVVWSTDKEYKNVQSMDYRDKCTENGIFYSFTFIHSFLCSKADYWTRIELCLRLCTNMFWLSRNLDFTLRQ